MRKILALDLGEKRVGYAVSDETRTLAFPRATLAKNPLGQFFTKLREIIQKEGISQILIGLPLDSENGEGKSASRIRVFGEKIGSTLMRPIVYIDEFGSTDEALSKIPFRKYRRQKGFSDAIAAQIILQRYLDEKK